LIVYVSELRPDLLDELCGKLYLIVNKVQQNNLKKLVIGSAADFSYASRFVIDLSGLKDTSDEIVEAVSAFKTIYADTRVIVIADREPENSPLFTRLTGLGVYDIVTDLDGDALKKCLTVGMSREEAEKPDVTSRTTAETPAPEPAAVPAPSPAREKIRANRDFKKHKQFVTVAVCGTEPHIGATQHALLMTKFLCCVGFRACYLEANDRRNILYLSRAYSVNANERKRLLQFEGVDMYFDFKLPEIVNGGYDFLIFDFGRFGELEPASFLTKDIKLVVGGTKAWEMPAYTPVFAATEGCRDVQFIMNHAPPGEKDGIRSLMGGYKTHFSDYAPYPFTTGANSDMYKEIFRDFLTVEQTAAQSEPGRTGRTNFFIKWKG
jgi:hypothetical protein